ncbi:FBD-associated F-box protein At4g10400-like [Aegilops tauschii subsp. strangulata]|uniref:FBD-associated F-box protein At4g10400-like n=1 Tax=Aegilops tauschii subsp. strangulata TaxID=200361 RepID=UPI000844A4DD|nr:FBD-associated F-box protein At4g10400-like [Aegilops tauschii subsp. strangulata]XP_044446860.1 FBD-associated F-box protein At4g10400-like [Triticum aestivum]
MEDDRQGPPGDGAEDLDPHLDLISRLPDELLGTVVSLLPTKDGARTQAVSRRWRPLWRSSMAPLNLIADYHLSEKDSRAALVSRILADHPGPARRFSIQLMFLPESLDEVDGWFRSGTLAGLHQLEATNLCNNHYPLPQHALVRFAPTLRVLSLGGCRFPDLARPPSFPHLKQLILYDVGISEGSLQSVISGCRVLQSVSLHNMGFGRLCIRSPTLRSIGFYAPRTQGVTTFRELVIEDAPCLDRLLPVYPDDGPATIRVIRAPKLQILGFLSEGISTLQFGTTVFQKMFAVSLTTKMYTLKILALDSIGPNLDAVIDFLKCFPCLEKLHVISHPQNAMNNVLKFDPLERIECLELHLKKVVLKNYNADKSPAVDFANFFILNAKVLEEMEIGVLHDGSYRSMCDKWMRDQHRPLQLDNRASQNARIELKRDGKAIPANHGHTHDLSLADPFDKSSCGCYKCVRYI